MRTTLTLLLSTALLLVAPTGAAPGAAAAAPATAAERAEAPAERAAQRAGLADRRRQVVRFTNRARRANGCAPLRQVATLNLAAQRHTKRMARARRLDHQLPGEPALGRRVTQAGYDWTRLGENIAYGYPTARSVVRAWLRSPGHRRNILDCRFRHIGVGFVMRGGTPWWTQDFGRR
ncbi:CAP domain-containing protein [Nocardioides sp. TF02-7]|uniref:CAP domain-containing protein n=1 Tax=Nocardioides sp. TF02-7 TaxID=2917724 RepID=UPI001F06858D|nr:CAP domain-containing protein [Nocardioides sp. TF02-7]UMG94333.1 CAP domain-containing protein [Nocardioides sp. TF02-7]